jgi:hypothetical protein
MAAKASGKIQVLGAGEENSSLLPRLGLGERLINIMEAQD